MGKIKLDLEVLIVDSFATGGWGAPGTVRAHSGALCTVQQSWDTDCGAGGNTEGCSYACTVPPGCQTHITGCGVGTCDAPCNTFNHTDCGGATCNGYTCGYLDPACASNYNGCPTFFAC
jgi:hypothetical protein